MTWTFDYPGGFGFRRVTPADLPSFHAVMMQAGMDPRSAWNQTTLEDLQRSLFGPGAGAFVAVDAENKIVGCVGFRPDLTDPQTLTLNKLATLPEVRGHGVARHLVGEVEGVARQGALAGCCWRSVRSTWARCPFTNGWATGRWTSPTPSAAGKPGSLWY